MVRFYFKFFILCPNFFGFLNNSALKKLEFSTALKHIYISNLQHLVQNQFKLKHFFFFTHITATDMIALKGNKIYSNAPLNYEQQASLKVNVQCHLKSTKSEFSRIDRKVFNITILDVNDNVIRLQGNHTVNIKLDSPYFQEVRGRGSFIKI
jgi:hypothetical protein